MRNPSIHIRRSDLIKIMEEEGLDTSKVNKLMEKALKYSIRNRAVVVAKSRAKKTIERASAVDIGIVDQFNRIYTGVTKDKNYKNPTIKKTDPQYLTLKEVAYQAEEFCEMFGLSREEGYKTYVEIAIELLDRKFSLYRMKGYYADNIILYYKNGLVISEDPTQEKTQKMYESWQRVLLEYFNQVIEVHDFNRYVNFVYAKNDADQLKANYVDWVTAQFEKWAYVGVVPELSQLYGENAAYNYQIYMANKNKSKKKSNDSKEEREYFEKISNKEIPLKKKTK